MNRILGTLLTATLLAACGIHPADSSKPAGGAAGKAGWTLLGDSPAPRSGQAAVYDAARDRMLVFGGGSNDLWAQTFAGPKANAWERLDATGDVPPPIGGVAVIDEGTDRLLVFPSDSLDRAWTLPLDGSGGWKLVGFGGAPTITLSFSLAVDAGGRRLFAYTSGSPEAWELSLDGAGTWTRLAGPPLQDGFSCRDDLVFDGANARLLVLSGGWPRGNVYALSLSGTPAWTQLNKDQAWFDYGAGTVYDPKASRFLIDGPPGAGSIYSFAVNDPAPAWTHLAVAGVAPNPRMGASGVYDSAHQRWVRFGGTGTDDAQSLHDDTSAVALGVAPAWSRVGALDDTMPANAGSALAFVAESGSVVRFGGWGASSGAGQPSLVFTARAGRWRPLGDTPTTPMSWSAGAWDPVGHRLVTFGGYTTTAVDSTWALDVQKPAWSEIDGLGARPAARSRHSMVLDASGGRMLVFGGVRDGSYFSGDTWALAVPGDTWTKLDLAGKGPAPRSAHAAAFDDAGRRMLVYGGMDNVETFGDTWMLELAPTPHWVELSPAASPPLHAESFAAFDPATGHFLLFFANLAAQPATTADGVSVWALSTDGPRPRWHRYCSKGTRPGTVDGAVGTRDGVLVTSHGSTWRFDPATPLCD